MRYADNEVAEIIIRTLNAGLGNYGIGAEIRVGGELIKVCSLYATGVPTKTDAVVYGCNIVIKEVPDGIKLVIFRSNERCFKNVKRMQQKLSVLVGTKYDDILFFHRHGIHKHVYWLAEDALKRKSDCIAKI